MWKLNGDGELVSRSARGLVWNAQGTNPAMCRAIADAPALHPAPEEDCTCGLYAFADLRDAARSLGWHRTSQGEALAIGRVSLWGKIVVAERGYRAQFAKVDELFAITEPYEVGPVAGLWGRHLSEVLEPTESIRILGGPHHGHLMQRRHEELETWHDWAHDLGSTTGRYEYVRGLYLWAYSSGSRWLPRQRRHTAHGHDWLGEVSGG